LLAGENNEMKSMGNRTYFVLVQLTRAKIFC